MCDQRLAGRKFPMAFPATRLRRLRQSEPLRSLVRETQLSPASLVYPMFVCPGEGVRREVRSMPGIFNLSVDEAVKEARQAHALEGAQGVMDRADGTGQVARDLRRTQSLGTAQEDLRAPNGKGLGGAQPGQQLLALGRSQGANKAGWSHTSLFVSSCA